MDRFLLHPRMFYGAVFLFCSGLILFGLWLEHTKGLEPCPMCITQRVLFIAVGTVALLATLHGSKGRVARIAYGVLMAVLAATGAGVAARQSWIQHYPPPMDECGADFYYLIDTTPLARIVPEIFSGTGECTMRQWVFLGLSIAEWAFVCFVAITVLSLWRTFAVHHAH